MRAAEWINIVVLSFFIVLAWLRSLPEARGNVYANRRYWTGRDTHRGWPCCPSCSRRLRFQ